MPARSLIAVVIVLAFRSSSGNCFLVVLLVSIIVIVLAFFAWFLTYEVTSSRQKRSIVKELGLSLVSSIFLGLATLFTLLWAGVYV